MSEGGRERCRARLPIPQQSAHSHHPCCIERKPVLARVLRCREVRACVGWRAGGKALREDFARNGVGATHEAADLHRQPHLLNTTGKVCQGADVGRDE